METSSANSSAGFEEIYHRNVDTVYRLCFSYLKNRTDAEDAVQSTFLKLLNADKVFSSPEHEKAWFIVVSSNICKGLLSHWWRKRIDIDDCEPLVMPVKQAGQELYNAVLALPSRYKTVVYLYYYEGYSTEEIASMLHKPVSTVRNQLSDARKKLQKRLEEETDVL